MIAVTERRWPTLVLTPIQVLNSIITVTDTVGLHAKQQITLSLGALQKDFEIKRVISKTQLKVGPKQELKGSSFNVFSNPVEFDGGTLTVVEQERNKVSWDIVGRAVYAEEPVVALRNVLVDRYGHYYSADNPLNVQLSDGSINIGSVNAELEVQLSHIDNNPDLGDVHDSVRVGDGVETLEINTDGSINVKVISPATANAQTIVNIPIVAANTEYSYALPANAKAYIIRVRNGAAVMQLGFYSGSSGTLYTKIPRGASLASGPIEQTIIPSLGLYFQTDRPNVVVEILIWSRI